MAKGSNLALHDAFMIAYSARDASCPRDILQSYSRVRVPEANRTFLLSRHLGRLRNGLLPGQTAVPIDEPELEALVRSCGLGTATLPAAEAFACIWEFVKDRLPNHARFF